MHTSLKASSALVLAALMGAPAFAATNDAAIVTNAMKTDALPIASVTAMVGKWSSADLSFLDKATAIKVFDTKALYDAADQKKIASAEAARNADLTKLHAAIAADAGLSTWFRAHNLDVNRVIAVGDPSGNPQVFLY